MVKIRDFPKWILLILIFLASSFAQTKKLSGIEDIKKLKIAVTTPEEVVSEFGKPSEDSVGKLEYNLLPSKFIAWMISGAELNFPESWVSKRKDEKIFRKLKFKNKNTLLKVELSFLENKLYLIDLTLSRKKSERLLAADLGKTFTAEFVSVGNISKDAIVADYENQKETSPKAYNGFYGMLSATPTTVYLAFVNHDSFEKEFLNVKAKPQENLFPGSVAKFQILDRNVR